MFCFVGCVGCCRLCFVVLFCVLVVYFLLGYWWLIVLYLAYIVVGILYCLFSLDALGL